MLKKTHYPSLVITVLCTLLFMGCGVTDKGDDNPELELKIEGKWKMEKVNFTDASLVEWDVYTDYTAGNYFAYAPAMYLDMIGFDFQDKALSDNSANKFVFIEVGSHEDVDSNEFWYWNYTEDGKSFEIGQINPQFPPYNFSLTEVNSVVLSDDGNKLEFSAKVNSRVSGGSIRDIVSVPVEFTMTRNTPGDIPEVYFENELFVKPAVLTTEEKLRNTHWKLEPGSDLYSPGMDDADNPEKAHLKIAALNLAENNMLNYRYAYPMGIVPAKEYEQEAVNDKKFVMKLGGNPKFGGEEVLITWFIDKIDLKNDRLILKDSENGDSRTFVLIDDINTQVDENDYNIVTE